MSEPAAQCPKWSPEISSVFCSPSPQYPHVTWTHIPCFVSPPSAHESHRTDMELKEVGFPCFASPQVTWTWFPCCFVPQVTWRCNSRKLDFHVLLPLSVPPSHIDMELKEVDFHVLLLSTSHMGCRTAIHSRPTKTVNRFQRYQPLDVHTTRPPAKTSPCGGPSNDDDDDDDDWSSSSEKKAKANAIVKEKPPAKFLYTMDRYAPMAPSKIAISLGLRTFVCVCVCACVCVCTCVQGLRPLHQELSSVCFEVPPIAIKRLFLQDTWFETVTSTVGKVNTTMHPYALTSAFDWTQGRDSNGGRVFCYAFKKEKPLSWKVIHSCPVKVTEGRTVELRFLQVYFCWGYLNYLVSALTNSSYHHA